jgi:hypothetical protein
VLNNPLSFTDPSGFFFSKLFGSIGKFFSNVFRAIGNVLKQVLKNPLIRSLITIVGCALPGVGQIGCAAISSLVSIAAGGSVADGLKAFAFSFVQLGVFSYVGPTLNGLVAAQGVLGAVIKAGVHGIIGGALAVAQGGSFMPIRFAGHANEDCRWHLGGP